MNMTIACSDARHPVNDWLTRWQSDHSWQQNIRIVRGQSDLTDGDIPGFFRDGRRQIK